MDNLELWITIIISFQPVTFIVGLISANLFEEKFKWFKQNIVVINSYRPRRLTLLGWKIFRRIKDKSIIEDGFHELKIYAKDKTMLDLTNLAFNYIDSNFVLVKDLDEHIYEYDLDEKGESIKLILKAKLLSRLEKYHKFINRNPGRIRRCWDWIALAPNKLDTI